MVAPAANITLKLPHLYDKQRAAVFDDARYSVVEASTKSGKTVGCIVWILAQAWEHGKSGRNYWWVAPTYPQAKIAFSRIKRMLIRVDAARQYWQVSESETWIELVSGGRIWFRGSDRPDTLYGEDVHALVVDEATRCREDAWHALRSTLTATKGPVRIIGNVRGRHNWAYRLARAAENGQQGMAYHKLIAADAVEAGVLGAEEVEDASRVLPNAIFRELYFAEPSDEGGNPFGQAAIQNCITDLSVDPVAVYGIDLAKSIDYTAVIGLAEDGSCCHLDRWQGVDWQQTRQRLVDLIGDTPALIDSTGVGDPIVEDIQRACPLATGFKFSSGSKQQLMEGLASAIQQEQVRFPDGWLINELSTFEYEYYRSGVKYSAPVGLHDDGVCALALAVRHLRVRSTATLEVRLIGVGDNEMDDERVWR